MITCSIRLVVVPFIYTWHRRTVEKSELGMLTDEEVQRSLGAALASMSELRHLKKVSVINDYM